MSIAPGDLAALGEGGSLGLEIRNLYGAGLEHREPIHRPGANVHEDAPEGGEIDRAVMRDHGQTIAVSAEDAHVLRLAQPRGALHHGVEDWLEIGVRARDDAQDL